jgi:hypothetical protein
MATRTHGVTIFPTLLSYCCQPVAADPFRAIDVCERVLGRRLKALNVTEVGRRGPAQHWEDSQRNR